MAYGVSQRLEGCEFESILLSKLRLSDLIQTEIGEKVNTYLEGIYYLGLERLGTETRR